jgi:hypothetical protein
MAKALVANAAEISIAGRLEQVAQIDPQRCNFSDGGAKTKEKIEINP